MARLEWRWRRGGWRAGGGWRPSGRSSRRCPCQDCATAGGGAGDGPVFAVGVQRHPLGAGPGVFLAGRGQPAHLPHDAVHHPVDGPAGAAHRSYDVVDGCHRVGWSAQEHPDRRHPVSHPGVPVVKNHPGLVAEGPVAALARVSPTLSLVPAVPAGIIPATARAERAAAHRTVLNNSAAASSPASNACRGRIPSALVFCRAPRRCGGSIPVDLFWLCLPGEGLYLPRHIQQVSDA